MVKNDVVRRAAVHAATLGPIGLWPWGPGTAASVVVTVLWLVARPDSMWVGIAAIVLTVIGVPIATRAERALGEDDGRIVIDEAAGMAWALVITPAGWSGAAISLLLFRIFDIVKPWPVRRFERIGGGLGVMLDDVAAGVMAAVVTAVLAAWLGTRFF